MTNLLTGCLCLSHLPPDMTERRFVLRDLSSWRECLDYLMSLRDKGGRFDVRIKPYSKKRSSEANRYYFGVCVKILADSLGYRMDDMHNVILMEYFGTDVKQIRGHEYKVPKRRSTTPETMSGFEFSGLIECAQQIASEMGIFIPQSDQEKAQ